MPERSCVDCTKKEVWGCTARRWKEPEPFEIDQPDNWVNPAQHPVHMMGETTYACPRQHVFQNPQMWSWMLKFYMFYKKGFLPQAGGLVDQPNKAMSVFALFDDANDRCDQALAERKAKQASRPAAPQSKRK
jgi:hypothetical protein